MPATLYALFWFVPKLFPAAMLRSLPPMTPVANFFALFWFVVVLFGRPLCVIALVLELILVCQRRTSVERKLLGLSFLVFAVLGTVLIESQAQHARH